MTDFGLSRDLKEDKDEQLRLRLYGRLGYVDPELLRKPRPPSAPRHDVFGLAVLYWEIMSRESPNSIQHSNRINPKRFIQAEGCPDEFHQLYKSCSNEKGLSTERPSAAKVVYMLKQILASMNIAEEVAPESSSNISESIILVNEVITSEMASIKLFGGDSGYQTGLVSEGT